MAVPYTFGSATAAIPLSQLDSNFATTITLGNTAVQLGNTITNLTGVSNLASANALSLGSNGNTTAVTIDTSQNVGIGTSSPATKLNVVDSGTGANTLLVQSGQTGTTPRSNTVFRLQTTATGRDVNIQFSDNVTNATEIGMVGGAQYFATGGTERMRIDSSGNVGIGTSSPGAKLQVAGTSGSAQFQAGTAANGYFQINAFDSSSVYCVVGGANATQAVFGSQSNIPVIFFTNNTERMRIDSSGNLLVGATSKGSIPGNSIVVSNGYGVRAGVGGGLGGSAFNLYWTGSATQLWIDGTNTGTITVVSDYRLKDKVETQTTPALSRINQLRPVTYKFKDYGSIFKADGVAREGFIAHELQAVIPSAVEGEKDAENQIQSLKLDALCSVLTKAIQELKALVDTQASTIIQLQADVAALKSK